jgi:ubiquinone/menaquinone biosynthesis C-methylase UbiE
MNSISEATTMQNAEDLYALYEQAYQEICKQGLEPRLNFLRQFMNIYDAHAKNFIPAPAVQNALLLSELFALEKSYKTLDIAEFGCLTSFMSDTLINAVSNSTMTFIDQSGMLLDICRLRFAEMGERVGYIKAPAWDFVQPNIFHAIRLGYMLSGYREDQKAHILKSAYASLKPGGIIFVQEFALRDDNILNKVAEKMNNSLMASIGFQEGIYKNYMHVTSESSLIHLLEQAGFTDITVPFSCLNFITFLARKPS